tara:strand:- start:1055 stop:1780 length:726 start_codon:yes stop_codon:yes gene_type:complete
MRKKIKVLLLSAGFGTRLRPITERIPKCLVEINGEKLLLNWLKKLEKIGCDEVLINTHYLSSQVEEVVKKWKSKNLKCKTIYEKELLGTAGTLRLNSEFFRNSVGLLIHADNFTNIDLDDFLKFHYQRKDKSIISMITFKTDYPRECGIVEVDKDNILIDYHEKVENPPTNIANGAIFAFDDSFIDYFLSLPNRYTNFCADIVPKLKGRIQTYFTNCFFIDIGTPRSLKLARELCKENNYG